MKKLISLLLFIQLFQLPAKADEGVSFFNGTYSEALAKAKEQNKLLFIDCYTTWCGPCQWMVAHAFTNDTVFSYFNKNFVCYKMDMEKGEGIDIAKKYAVRNYPTYLWVDASGNQIHRAVGAMPVAFFMRIAGNAMSADNNLSYLEEQYNSGNKKPALLLAYAYSLRDAYNTMYQTVADEYFRSQPPADLNNETNWKTIVEFTPNMDSYIYGMITKNPAPFYDRYGKDSVQHELDKLALESLLFASQQSDSVLLEKAVAQLKLSKDKDIQKEAARGELDYYKRNGNMQKYTTLAPAYVTKHFWKDAKALNEVCWTYFMKVDDKAKLANAEKWIAQSVKLDDSNYNTDTYANILHKEGKNKEAIAMTKHSIEMAKKTGQQYSSTQELLDALLKENGTSNSK